MDATVDGGKDIILTLVNFDKFSLYTFFIFTESFDIITAHENNGSITLSFTGEYELSQREHGIYDISVYNTVWSELFDTMQRQVITVNPNREEVNTIYYVTNGGQEDKVIYGDNPITNGGVMTLPRLFLNYYIAVAFLIAVVLTLLLLLFRKKQKIRTIIVEILFAPISYIVSHIMITGFNATSYSATRDFYLILLLVIPIYFLFYFLYKKKHSK